MDATLTSRIETEAKALGFELVRVAMIGGKSDPTLQIMAERPDTGQLDLGDCEALSRRISDILDEMEAAGRDPVEGAYRLEVSSPGIDRLIFNAAQANRFVGSQAKVALSLPQDGRRRVQGTIHRAGDEGLVLLVDGGAEFVVPFDNIDKARLVPDYAALGLAPNEPKAPRPRRKRTEGTPETGNH